MVFWAGIGWPCYRAAEKELRTNILKWYQTLYRKHVQTDTSTNIIYYLVKTKYLLLHLLFYKKMEIHFTYIQRLYIPFLCKRIHFLTKENLVNLI